jgi:hypothetical protein
MKISHALWKCHYFVQLLHANKKEKCECFNKSKMLHIFW